MPHKKWIKWNLILIFSSTFACRSFMFLFHFSYSVCLPDRKLHWTLFGTFISCMYLCRFLEVLNMVTQSFILHFACFHLIQNRQSNTTSTNEMNERKNWMCLLYFDCRKLPNLSDKKMSLGRNSVLMESVKIIYQVTKHTKWSVCVPYLSHAIK